MKCREGGHNFLDFQLFNPDFVCHPISFPELLVVRLHNGM